MRPPPTFVLVSDGAPVMTEMDVEEDAEEPDEPEDALAEPDRIAD